MFKSISIALTVVLAIVGYTQAGMSDDEMKALFTDLGKKCAESTGATADERTQMKESGDVASKRAQCMRLCICQNIGVMENDKFLPDGLIKAAAMLFGEGSPQVEVAKQTAADCSSVTGSDECETGSKVFDCVISKMRAKGVSFQLV